MLSRIERYDDGRLTMSFIVRSDYEETGADENYSEGIVDHIRALEGTVVGALVREQLKEGREGVLKVSLRASADEVDVSVIARKEGGGGHRQAAGFSSTRTGTELIEFLRAEIAAQQLTVDGPGWGPAGCEAGGGHVARRRGRVRRDVAAAPRSVTPGRSIPLRPGCWWCSRPRDAPAALLVGLPKAYRVVARLGAVSDTGDPTGEVAETGEGRASRTCARRGQPHRRDRAARARLLGGQGRGASGSTARRAGESRLSGRCAVCGSSVRRRWDSTRAPRRPS